MTDQDATAAPENLSRLSQGMSEVSQASTVLSRTLTSAFDQIIIKGKSASDVFGSLALSMSQSLLQSSMQSLQQGLSGAFTNLFSGGAPSLFANGGIVHGGLPVPFAQGGIIASPMTFPLAGGRAGIAGERGAEAIVPLARGPDGRLGIAGSGTGGNTITVNITATDIDSFRRSEAQVAALLTRAVSRGQRNL